MKSNILEIKRLIWLAKNHHYTDGFSNYYTESVYLKVAQNQDLIFGFIKYYEENNFSFGLEYNLIKGFVHGLKNTEFEEECMHYLNKINKDGLSTTKKDALNEALTFLN